MEQPTRMQDVLPMFSERGVGRIVAEKKLNPRSIPFRDGEFSQWYRVGKRQRGGYWRPYKVTVIVLECVLMMVSSLFFAYTLFYMNIETDSILGYFITHRNLVAQQNTDAAAMIVHAFDVHVTYPHIWFTWLLLPAGISAIIFPLLTIMLLSGQEKGTFKWLTFLMHAFSVFALLPLGIEVLTLELDLNAPGAYSFVQSDFNKKIYAKEEPEFLQWWAWYASFYERRFMHFYSDETLIRSLEREIPCCGIDDIDEYWKPHNFTRAKFPKFRPPLRPEIFSHYMHTDWQKIAYKKTGRLLAYPESCCDNCEILYVKTFAQKQKQMKSLKKKITILAPTCKPQMKDMRLTQTYPLYVVAVSIIFLNILLCVFIGMSNFCKWVTEGIDEEKYIDEIKDGKIFHDKLRDRQRVLNEGANNIYNTAIRVDNQRNRLAIQTQITQYVPTVSKRRRKHWKTRA